MAKKTNFKKLAVLGLLGFAAFKIFGKKEDKPKDNSNTGGGVLPFDSTKSLPNTPPTPPTPPTPLTPLGKGNIISRDTDMAAIGGWKRKR
jgi:hypothetical protein